MNAAALTALRSSVAPQDGPARPPASSHLQYVGNHTAGSSGAAASSDQTYLL